MKWFKHYANASDSVKLNNLIDELGVEGYGRYWLLLEMLAEEYDGKSEEFEVHFRKISAKVQIKFSKKLETFLQKLSDFHLIDFRISGKVYFLSAPILSDLKQKDFKRSRPSRDHAATTPPLDIDKDKEEDIDKDNKKIKPENLIKLWNSKCPESKKYPSLFIGGKHRDNFLNITGFPDFQKLEHWKKLYDIAFSPGWLSERGPLSFTWLLNHDNAMDVLSGKYASRSLKSKNTMTADDLPDLEVVS